MKIIGSLIIIFSSVMIANSMNKKIDRSISSVSALRALFEHTKNMIECYSLPASEILRRLESSCLFALGYLKDELPRDFFELEKHSQIEDTEAREMLVAFSKDFGKSYRADELLRCSLFVERARAREQKLIKDAIKRKKVNLTVAICSALSIIILIA